MRRSKQPRPTSPQVRSDGSSTAAKSVRGSLRRHGPVLYSVGLHAAAVFLLALITFSSVRNGGRNAVIVEPTAESEADADSLSTIRFAPTLDLPETEEPPLDAEFAVSSLLTSPAHEAELLLPHVETSLSSTVVAVNSGTKGTQSGAVRGGGAAHVAVGNYDDAMDEITRELIRLLQNGEVVVVWLFDQSTSMEDDRQQIGARIGRVYAELAASGVAEKNALTTGIASYSGDYAQHTSTPTSSADKIYSAIEAVPIDTIGTERTCQAVREAILRHRRYVESTKRQFALIVVTDESGDPADNRRYLEDAIAEAKATNCHVYVLGREAMFGYPFEHYVSRNPQTGEARLASYDRGPETALLEQLQTDGFSARRDTVLSGFGPYEQVRLTRETGGIFFMMPDDKQQSGQRRTLRYDPRAMKDYLPDWRPRDVVATEAQQDPLQTILSQVISELNPFESANSGAMEIREIFSTNATALSAQMQQERAKMRAYAAYLDQAIRKLELAKPLRDSSPSLRQQANYDLLLAQLLTYRIRADEFHDYLSNSSHSRPIAPPGAPIEGWRIATRQRLTSPKKHTAEIAHARILLEQIVVRHKGTPWEVRAQDELDQGFGVGLEPAYPL